MDSSSGTLVMDRDSVVLGGLFQNIVHDLRCGSGNWDDLLLKANKFHMQLKSTISASTTFLDAFQKIADMATTTRSGTKEIGSALTRLCLRHRSVEAKLKALTSSMLDSFILPLQDRVEEWKKIISQLDKDHNKELKRLKQFKKKHSPDGRTTNGFANSTFRIKRHPRSKMKGDFPRIGSMFDMNKIGDAMDNKEKYFMLEEVERNYVRRALIEERSHYCLFFNLLRPVVEEEISMLQEITHLEEVIITLQGLTSDPYQLPPASETLLTNLQLNESISLELSDLESCAGTSFRSRKSSISSITSINSLSTDSISLSQHCKSLSQPNITPEFRPKSIASQDSGFISHDYNVPNLGRLVISNNKNSKTQENICINGNVCILNGKTILCSESHRGKLSCCARPNNSCNQCTEGAEYASSDQLYGTPGNVAHYNNQPIYVNIADSYSVPNGFCVNASDGSVTPTNQDSCPYDSADNLGCSQMMLQSDHRDVPPKPNRNTKLCPPKPPARHSSSLSNVSKQLIKPPDVGNVSKTSTRIYVVQNQENSLDFPPPPPEAYIDYSNRNQDESKSIACCQYPIPSHLVLCNDLSCLKKTQPSGSEKCKSPRNGQSYGVRPDHTESVRKSYAFESNLNFYRSSTSGDSGSPGHYLLKSCTESMENDKSTNRLFHSTINLADAAATQL